MTLAEIARKFNVTSVTVSKALNHRTGVSETLGNRIRDYARKIGYTPNFAARSLASGDSKIIGIYLRGLPNDAWNGVLLTQFQERLMAEGYYVTTMFSGPIHTAKVDIDRDIQCLNFFRQINTKAILIGPMDPLYYRKLIKKGGPTDQLIAFDSSDAIEAPHIQLKVGIDMSLEYLHQHGHRRIAAVGYSTWERKHIEYGGRITGYLNFMHRHGLPIEQDWLIENPEAIPGKYVLEHVKKILSRPDRPTALLCYNDSNAIVAMKAAVECGLKIPQDLSVTGCDDYPMAKYIDTGITTLRYDLNEYMDKMVELTLARIRNEDMSNRSFVLNATLIERGSVADV